MINVAGFKDVAGLYQDQPTIIDFKQSNKPKENGLQITIYK